MLRYGRGGSTVMGSTDGMIGGEFENILEKQEGI